METFQICFININIPSITNYIVKNRIAFDSQYSRRWLTGFKSHIIQPFFTSTSLTKTIYNHRIMIPCLFQISVTRIYSQPFAFCENIKTVDIRMSVSWTKTPVFKPERMILVTMPRSRPTSKTDYGGIFIPAAAHGDKIIVRKMF